MRKVFTQDGKLLLIPEDMSPEQARNLADTDSGKLRRIRSPIFPSNTDVYTLRSLSRDEVIDGVRKAFPKNGELAEKKAQEEMSPLNLLKALNKLQGQAAGQFGLGALEGAAEFPVNLINLVLSKDKKITPPRHGQGTPYEAGRLGGDIATFIGAGAPIKGALRGLAAIPKLHEGAKALLASESALAAIPRRAVGTGAYEAIQNPEHPVLGGIGGALASGLIDAGGLGVSRGLSGTESRARLSKEFKERFGKNWENALKERLEGSSGLETPIGDVLDSGELQRYYENILSRLPFTGTAQAYDRTKRKLIDEGEELVGKYMSGIPSSEVDKELVEELKKSHEAARKAKVDIYKKADAFANKEGLKISLDSTKELMKDAEEELANSFELKVNKKLRQEFKELASNLSKNESPKMVDLTRLSNQLYEAAKKADLKREDSALLKAFSSTIRNDINSSIDAASPAIKSKYNEAKKLYREKYAPFRDEDVTSVLYDKTEPEKVVSKFINLGPVDAVTQMRKLTDVLSDRGDNLLKRSILKRLKAVGPTGEADPRNIARLWSDPKKLGENQKKALFPDKKDRDAWDKYAKRVSINDKAFTDKANPPTGQKLSNPLLHAILLGTSIEKPLLGAGIGGYSAIKAARMRSPKVREKLIQSMLSGGLEEKGARAASIRQLIQQMLKPSASSIPIPLLYRY